MSEKIPAVKKEEGPGAELSSEEGERLIRDLLSIKKQYRENDGPAHFDPTGGVPSFEPRYLTRDDLALWKIIPTGHCNEDVFGQVSQKNMKLLVSLRDAKESDEKYPKMNSRALFYNFLANKVGIAMGYLELGNESGGTDDPRKAMEKALSDLPSYNQEST